MSALCLEPCCPAPPTLAQTRTVTRLRPAATKPSPSLSPWLSFFFLHPIPIHCPTVPVNRSSSFPTQKHNTHTQHKTEDIHILRCYTDKKPTSISKNKPTTPTHTSHATFTPTSPHRTETTAQQGHPNTNTTRKLLRRRPSGERLSGGGRRSGEAHRPGEAGASPSPASKTKRDVTSGRQPRRLILDAP